MTAYSFPNISIFINREIMPFTWIQSSSFVSLKHSHIQLMIYTATALSKE